MPVSCAMPVSADVGSHYLHFFIHEAWFEESFASPPNAQTKRTKLTG
jgi:hypothetical protein